MPQVYEPFYADFGPLNLGLTYRFCQKTQNNLQVLASMAKHQTSSIRFGTTVLEPLSTGARLLPIEDYISTLLPT